MVIENENERPALKLRDCRTGYDRFWAIYSPEYNAYGNNGYYVALESAERFDTFDAALKARKKDYGYPARVAFVEVTINVHYNEEEEERS